MEHPILNSVAKALVYFILLSIMGIALYFFYLNVLNYEQQFIVTDVVISILLIGIMNLGLWYFVRYSNYDDSSVLNSIVKHFLFAFLYTLIWFIVSYVLVLFFVEKDDEYTIFWQSTFGFKVLLSVLLYFIMIFFYNFIIYQFKNKETLQHQRDLALLLQKEELNSLKSQINPHFLFNSLNSISYLVYLDPDKAHEAIVKLSEYFRFTLTLSKSQLTRLQDEIDHIKRYLEIEQLRFPDKMQLFFEIDNNCNNMILPSMILQPLIENAIKHGVYQNSEKTIIRVIVKILEKNLLVEISNNFEETTKMSKGTNTGLQNVKKRLALIYNRFDLMNISKQENIYLVKIYIPQKIEL